MKSKTDDRATKAGGEARPLAERRELAKIIDSMRREASGARELSLTFLDASDDEIREAIKHRAEALEQYAAQLTELLPESGGDATEGSPRSVSANA